MVVQNAMAIWRPGVQGYVAVGDTKRRLPSILYNGMGHKPIKRTLLVHPRDQGDR
jgi:hypothetical protein